MRKKNYFPLIVLILIAFSLDFYVYQGIKLLTANPYYLKLIDVLYWLVSICVLFSFVYILSRVLPSREFTRVFNISFNSFLTLFVTKLVFSSVLLGEDIFRMGSAILHAFLNDGFRLPERSVWVSRSALLLSSIPFFSFIFGVTIGKYNYKIRRTVLYFEDLPDDFHDFNIVQISDIHAGSFDNTKAVKNGINLINSLNADLFVFTGDLVNNKASEILPYLEIFGSIQAGFGKFSILGNHDYGDYIGWENSLEKDKNLELLKKYHRELGFNLLLDQHIRIKKGNDQIALLGIENWGKGFGQRGNLAKALHGLDQKEFKILLSHDPSHWDAQVRPVYPDIDLMLAGHTHGMQFGVRTEELQWSPVQYIYPEWAGLYREQNQQLYVNVGYGFLGYPGRVGIQPEITIFELRRA